MYALEIENTESKVDGIIVIKEIIDYNNNGSDSSDIDNSDIDMNIINECKNILLNNKRDTENFYNKIQCGPQKRCNDIGGINTHDMQQYVNNDNVIVDKNTNNMTESINNCSIMQRNNIAVDIGNIMSSVIASNSSILPNSNTINIPKIGLDEFIKIADGLYNIILTKYRPDEVWYKSKLRKYINSKLKDSRHCEDGFCIVIKYLIDQNKLVKVAKYKYKYLLHNYTDFLMPMCNKLLSTIQRHFLENVFSKAQIKTVFVSCRTSKSYEFFDELFEMLISSEKIITSGYNRLNRQLYKLNTVWK